MPITPDDFRDDPLGEGGNQAGHIIIGAFIVSALTWLGVTLPWAVGTGIAIGAAWELRHFLKMGAKGKDSRNDFLFYCLGLAYPGPLWWTLAGGAVLGFHVWWRWRALRRGG